jgi:hypothetical protein
MDPRYLNHPNRNSKLTVQGVLIAGEMLWYNPQPYAVGTHLFLTESGTIDEDPHILSLNPPEVQLLGIVIKGGYIYVTPKRLPVLL